MTYPSTLPYSNGSQRIIRSGVEHDIATDGTVRGRRFFSADAYEWHLIHFGIDSTAKDGLISNFETYRTASQDYVWDEDSTTYTVYYLAPPIITALGGDIFQAEVVLYGHAP